MAGHDFVDAFAQELLPALWAVRLPYGLPREPGSKEPDQRASRPQRRPPAEPRLRSGGIRAQLTFGALIVITSSTSALPAADRSPPFTIAWNR